MGVLTRTPLVDLPAQYDTMRAEIDRAMAGVVESQRFVLGPPVGAFEEAVAERVGVRHAVGCANGTDAIWLVLRALGPGRPDEVIVPAFTFFGTAGAVWNAGLRPVFCDVDPETFNVNANTVRACWSDRTRVVLPVHLFGQMAPMAELLELARERGAHVVEDAAQALDARQRTPGGAIACAGASGTAGTVSFFPTKNLGGYGDGGLIVTDDDALARRLRRLRVHGGVSGGRYDAVGVNSRLDSLQAAVLHAKLPRLTQWTESRRANAAVYDEMLAGVPGVRRPRVLSGNFHTYHQYTIRARERDRLRDHLRRRGLETGVYYPRPLHLQPCFSELGYRPGDLPVAETACREVLSLPVFPELGADGAARVARAIRDFFRAG